MDIEQNHLKKTIASGDIPSSFKSPFAKQLKAELIAFDHNTKTLTCAFEVPDQYLHGGGVIQGGIIASMLDFTMAMLSLAIIDEGHLVATTDLHTQFLKPALPGKFTATATFARRGRTAHFCKADIVDEHNKAIATGIATNMIISPK